MTVTCFYYSVVYSWCGGRLNGLLFRKSVCFAGLRQVCCSCDYDYECESIRACPFVSNEYDINTHTHIRPAADSPDCSAELKSSIVASAAAEALFPCKSHAGCSHAFASRASEFGLHVVCLSNSCVSEHARGSDSISD